MHRPEANVPYRMNIPYTTKVSSVREIISKLAVPLWTFGGLEASVTGALTGTARMVEPEHGAAAKAAPKRSQRRDSATHGDQTQDASSVRALEPDVAEPRQTPKRILRGITDAPSPGVVVEPEGGAPNVGAKRARIGVHGLTDPLTSGTRREDHGVEVSQGQKRPASVATS